MRSYSLGLCLVFAALCVVFRFLPAHLPMEIRIWVIPPLAGFALLCGARLSWWMAPIFVLGAAMIGDAFLYLSRGWEPVPIVYLCLLLNLVLARLLVGPTSRNWFRIFGTGGLAAILFFLVTNFAAWVEKALPEYEYTFSGLMYAFGKGLEFLRLYPGSALSELVWFPLMILGYDLVNQYAEAQEKDPTRADYVEKN